MNYVTPADMLTTFDHAEIVQATNLGDPAAEQINDTKLQKACDGANGMAYGYLATRYSDAALQPENLSAGFLMAFKVHCLQIARYLLDGSGEEIQAKYTEAKEYFQWMAESDRLTKTDLDPGITADESVPTLAFEIQPTPGWDAENLVRLFGDVF